MADPANPAIEDTGLALLTDRGELLRPVSNRAGRLVFILPETVRCLRLRPLGALVGAVKLTRGGRAVALRIDDSPEAGRANGDAALTIPDNGGLRLPGVLEMRMLAVRPAVKARTGVAV